MNINNLKVKLGTRLFGLGWGIFNLATAPAVAEPIAVEPSNSDYPASTRVISRQAQDLFPASERLVKLDLEKFCQDYPYNSRCSGKPGSLERSPIPVPVPPPEPPNGDREQRHRQRIPIQKKLVGRSFLKLVPLVWEGM